MSTTIPLAAIRILRPMQGRRPLSSYNLAAEATGGDSGDIGQGPTDPITLSNEFDRGEAVQDLKNQLEKAGFTDIDVVPVSIHTIVEVAEELEKEMKRKQGLGQDLVVFQLCDGTELDGYPGVSMIYELENRQIAFTGSDSAFYIISSSKPILKRELQAAHVPTSAFQEFVEVPRMNELDNIINEIGFPMIVKPSISYASINISMNSVVHTPEQLLEQINLSLTASKTGGKLGDQIELVLEQDQKPLQMQQQVKMSEKIAQKDKTTEFDIETPTVFVEKFLAGLEFTVLVVGDKDWGIRVFPVAERAFDPKLGKFERLLAFDQYWDGYDLEGGGGNEDFCKYQMADDAWQKQLQQVAKEAYLALDGNGYGRVDIRTVEMDKCEPVVLEVNANCGLSFEKDSSSLANILLMSNVSPPGFVRDLVEHALHRNKRLNGMTHTHLQDQWLSNAVYRCDADNEHGRVEVLVRS
ncbi:hypothetical protein EDD21DRAFT_403546 [Dissophora ornata]|nr:hypothetical protein BGZ58_004414 [Dissophora ornata]KAI8602555.1 hypothetical protein EDD21DRAFT_403546 [Dissophora ornata]